jgi:integrase
VAIGPSVVELLRARRVEQAKQVLAGGVSLSPDAYVFSHVSHETDGSKPIRPDGVTQRFTALARRLGVQCRLHDLRHFLVTQLIASGWTCGPSRAESGTATVAARPWGPMRISRPRRTARPPS